VTIQCVHVSGQECEEDPLGCSPRRALARREAFRYLCAQGERMKKTAKKKDGCGEVLQCGQVVRISLADVDRAKTDSTTAVCVVVEAVETGEKQKEIKYRLACANGVLKSLRVRSHVKPAKPGVTPLMMGLQDALVNWKSMPEVGDRACARALSAAGGQGLLHCACKGACDGGKCSCFAAGRECNSRCHKENAKCKNKML
jgi:hypothetical protein